MMRLWRWRHMMSRSMEVPIMPIERDPELPCRTVRKTTHNYPPFEVTPWNKCNKMQSNSGVPRPPMPDDL
jgi:hypothetical protein